VFIGQDRDLGMSECGNAMSDRRSRGVLILMRLRRVLQGLP
jgi:hypothetical protein